MAFEIQALDELRPNSIYRAFEHDDGTFVLEWDSDKNNGKAAPTTEEINTKAAEIKKDLPYRKLRRQRKELLAETDWMANSDVTMTDAWKTYRQQLRDLPANTSDPLNPTWPTKPS